ncbi:unnamed protein product, partial [marine sediment metagenome]
MAFVIGAIFSAVAGNIGMRVATMSNARTAEGTKKSVSKGLTIAFSSGGVMGMCVVGLGVLGVFSLFVFFNSFIDLDLFTTTNILFGFGFGASSIALFARVGGGIYTKSADVGADLVGKVEAGIPEDDPRNPAVIADQVGDNVVEMNWKAVDAALDKIEEIKYPKSWKDLPLDQTKTLDEPDFVKNVMKPMLAQQGDKLPVSAFTPAGIFPTGTTKYEKRGIAINIPEWQIDNCIQCNQCALVCPHAAIRPVLVTDEELKNAPSGFETKKAVGKDMEGLHFRIQLYPEDCV